MRKELKVLTKRQFNDAKVDSLFTSGGTLQEEALPYCTGKYNDNIIGSLLNVSKDIKAVFGVVKYDKDGRYIQLRYSL